MSLKAAQQIRRRCCCCCCSRNVPLLRHKRCHLCWRGRWDVLHQDHQRCVSAEANPAVLLCPVHSEGVSGSAAASRKRPEAPRIHPTPHPPLSSPPHQNVGLGLKFGGCGGQVSRGQADLVLNNAGFRAGVGGVTYIHARVSKTSSCRCLNSGPHVEENDLMDSLLGKTKISISFFLYFLIIFFSA